MTLYVSDRISIIMIKFVKIVFIGFCFGICNLRSENYNVITVSRNTRDANYDKLAPEEIRFVFDQLSELISDEPLKEAKTGDPSKKLPLTIVVFNEAFFGQYKPLSKKEVDEITSCCKELHNTCLYMNFLYTDFCTKENKEEYVPQIEISKIRYTEILAQEGNKNLGTIKQPSFVFSDRVLNCIEEKNFDELAYSELEKELLKSFRDDGVSLEQPLLFNQTKIFYGGKEIGYYNKSSFCNEIPDFLKLDKKPYYVIGNFNTIYKERCPLQIDCLTCYDIDVVSNGCYQRYMEGKSIFAFSSNSSCSLPCALFDIYGVLASKKILFICSDPYKDEVTAPIDCKKQDELCFKCLSGVFEYKGSFLSPIKEIKEITCEYVKAKETIVKKEEEDEEPAESKDIFSLKKFSLTLE